MSENNEKKNYNVMPTESNIQTAETPSMMNGLTWLLGGLLLVAVIAIIWMLAMKNDGPSVTSPSDSSIVATVNGTNISADDLVGQIPENEKAAYIDRAIFQLLIEEEAKKANIEITEGDLDAALELQLAEFDHMFFDQEEFDSVLAMQNTTLDQLKEDIKNGPDLLLQLKMEKLFEDKIQVSDEEIAQYFEENKEGLNQGKQIQASHILVESEDLAASILEEINGGADFAELAMEHSTDGSSERGGDLGTFGRGQMVAPFEEAAFNLEVGEVSDVVQSEFGYHIIKLTGKQREYTLEEDKEVLRSYIFREEMNQLFGEWMEGVREAAQIEIM